MAKKKLTKEEITARIQKVNPKLTLDFSTYVNTATNAKFFEEGYGEFWTRPNDVFMGKTKGHPSSSRKRQQKFNLQKYGVEHFSQTSSFKKKTKETNLKRHGVESPFQSPTIRAKARKTNQERYGAEHPMQNPEIFAKAKKTSQGRYGVEYAMQSPKIQVKARKTMVKRYGVEYPIQNPEIQEKTKKTNQERYGADNPFQSPEIQAKTREINQEKYGVDYPFQSPEIQRIVRQNNLESIGFESPFQSPVIQAKIKETNKKIYGVENPSSSVEVKEKRKKTNLERHGVENPMQNPEIQAKARQTLIDRGHESTGEAELRQFIASLGFSAVKKTLGGSPGFEVDIVVPEKGVAFEYNGDFFHSEWSEKIHPKYHLEKTLRCAEKGWQLVHVFESEWTQKPEIFKDFIKAKLGVFDRKLMARKLAVRPVSKAETKEFFEKNHLQGAPVFWKTFGLYDGQELVSAASFSKPHRQNMGAEPHLSRFACSLGTSVVGGLSRLCVAAHKEIGPFVSFVHLRLSNGNSYEKAGFRLLGTSKPDYWYWDSRKNRAVSKQSRKKGAVGTPSHMTEHEHALQDGLYKIWDCGKKKYIFEK